MAIRLDEAEKKINYIFKNPSYLIRAFTHPSFLNGKNYQNLEFLGDSIVNFVIAEYFFNKYPSKDEGFLTRLRSSVVSEKPLSEAIDRLDVSDCMLVGEGGKKQNITCLSSVKSDLFESIAGAIYLDGGIEPAQKFVLENLAEELENAKADAKDAKSKLNEYGSKHGVEIEYKLLSETGADHNPQFVFEVVVDDKVMGKGTGGTKREAQQNCAKIALSKLSKQKKL